MRLLLDTHVWLWAMAEPERLSGQAREAIETAAELVLSVASLWELGIKQALGKLTIPAGLEGLRAEARRLGGTELVIGAEHALLAAGLPPHHRDPFDRMLVAQARVEGLTLVTADAQLQPYGASLLWAI